MLTLEICHLLNIKRDPEPHVSPCVGKGNIRQHKVCFKLEGDVWSCHLSLGQIQLDPGSWGSSEMGEQERSSEGFMALC